MTRVLVAGQVFGIASVDVTTHKSSGNYFMTKSYCWFFYLLHRNYLNSGWCKEEFQLAHLESVEGRHRFIILIMLEDIKTEDLPDEMQKYVKTYTYICNVVCFRPSAMKKS